MSVHIYLDTAEFESGDFKELVNEHGITYVVASVSEAGIPEVRYTAETPEAMIAFLSDERGWSGAAADLIEHIEVGP